MNWVDIVLLIVSAYFILRGLWSGFIKSVFRYLALGMGILVSLWFYPEAAHFLKGQGLHLSDFWLKSLAIVCLFAIVLAIVQGTGILLSKLIKPTPLGPADRILGGGLGAFKSLAIALLLSYLVTRLPLPKIVRSHFEKSVVLQNISHLTPHIQPLLNRDFDFKEAVGNF